jgi:methionyl-tRNA synthetase
MSAGVDLPKRVFGHGFLLVKGEKMSKSVGNVVDPFNLADTYGVDQIRYFFLREVPFGQDGSYSPEGIANRINADLANDLGNLAQRSLSMIAKNCEGKVPARGALADADREILAAADALPEKARAAMERFAIHAMLADVWAVVGDANRYFASQEPWALRKTDPERMETVLWVTIEVLRAVGIAAAPAIPSAAAKLLDLLGVPADRRMLADVGEGGRLASGAPLPAPAPIFPRWVAPETVVE